MPNRQEHLDIGLAVAIAVGVILLADETRIPPIAELIGTGVGVLGGAVLPDILEPADSPNHRKSGHSTVALGGSMKLGVDPPDSVTEWRRSVRETAAAMREKRESLPTDHPDRPGL